MSFKFGLLTHDNTHDCALRPAESEVFNLMTEYEHISDWIRGYTDESRQFQESWLDEGKYGVSLRFEMKSWKAEAAKRIVKSPGFARLRFRDVFDTETEDTDAKVLYHR